MTPPPESLTQKLREATREAHGRVEAIPLFAAMADGTISRSDYAAYLGALAPIYRALERGLEQCREDPALATLARPELYRSSALAADLAVLGGTARCESEVPLAAGIARAAAEAPHRLAAYFYVRYFGDLSGGQMLARILGPALGLTAARGLAFYEFPQLPAPAVAKSSLREALDGLLLDERQQAEVLAEAVAAFAAHGSLLDSPVA